MGITPTAQSIAMCSKYLIDSSWDMNNFVLTWIQDASFHLAQVLNQNAYSRTCIIYFIV